ncbi:MULTISPECIES: hypothetical protein [unclassified Nocardiopsis]|uniref:hypothetical protein n=1 Tax=unclassified Nocardiopsis TaxID=2649073 RepID=UPI001F2D0132|nr:MULTISPECIES: hypothetical protein [unclassified Nocardiopsis]
MPYADRGRFRAWTRDAADLTDRARSERGVGDLFSYGLDLALAVGTLALHLAG